MTRPIFYPELSKFFTRLRETHDYSQRQLADLAERRGLDLTYNTIRGLERGGTKHIEQASLRALAKIYSVPYEVIAAEVIQHIYGLSVSANGGTQDIAVASRLSAPTTLEEAVADIQRSTARLLASIPTRAKRGRRNGT